MIIHRLKEEQAKVHENLDCEVHEILASRMRHGATVNDVNRELAICIIVVSLLEPFP
jgi:hypothetical protein